MVTYVLPNMAMFRRYCACACMWIGILDYLNLACKRIWLDQESDSDNLPFILNYWQVGKYVKHALETYYRICTRYMAV